MTTNQEGLTLCYELLNKLAAKEVIKKKLFTEEKKYINWNCTLISEVTHLNSNTLFPSFPSLFVHERHVSRASF